MYNRDRIQRKNIRVSSEDEVSSTITRIEKSGNRLSSTSAMDGKVPDDSMKNSQGAATSI
jgi:hypothetical protein